MGCIHGSMQITRKGHFQRLRTISLWEVKDEGKWWEHLQYRKHNIIGSIQTVWQAAILFTLLIEELGSIINITDCNTLLVLTRNMNQQKQIQYPDSNHHITKSATLSLHAIWLSLAYYATSTILQIGLKNTQCSCDGHDSLDSIEQAWHWSVLTVLDPSILHVITIEI